MLGQLAKLQYWLSFMPLGENLGVDTGTCHRWCTLPYPTGSTINLRLAQGKREG